MMNKQEFVALHPWIDPTKGYPDSTLRDGVRKIEPTYIAIKNGGAHKSIEWMTAVPTVDLEKIDGHDWELFTATCEDEKYVWGMFVEGIGALNVMVPKEYIRNLTDGERKKWSGRKLVMVGSHSGKESYGFKMPEL